MPSVEGLGTVRVVVLLWSDRHDARVDRVVLHDGRLRVEATRELPGDGCSSTAEVTAWTTVAAGEVPPADAGALDQIELAAADTEVSCD